MPRPRGVPVLVCDACGEVYLDTGVSQQLDVLFRRLLDGPVDHVVGHYEPAADTAAQRLRLQAGLWAVAEWEHEHGPLTGEERADGLGRARALLGPGGPSSSA